MYDECFQQLCPSHVTELVYSRLYAMHISYYDILYILVNS